MPMYGCTEDEIAHYTSFRVANNLKIDGNLDKVPWKKAPKASLVDLVSGEPAFLSTEIAALWDEQYFYVGFWVEEPNIQATFTKRDSLIYLENDIELFIGGKDCYYEFQINALGTIYEVFYIWQDAYTKTSRFACAEFDLTTQKVDILGGFQDLLRYNNHPRGRRWAFVEWDFPGLKSAVKVQGTINDPSDRDLGWMVELAFPWDGMTSLFGESFAPPKNDLLRVNFSRFEALKFCGHKPEIHPGWSLNKHGVYDSHIPRCFSYVHLSNKLLPEE